jgi:hypothetical protein
MAEGTAAASCRNVGLRIDVDTWRGTRDGVPALCRVLAGRSIRASFFFSVGPDNMGRHLWRLLRPRFLLKMLRSNAASLYGWDILLRGTFWPGPRIGRGAAAMIREAAVAGHEIGFRRGESIFLPEVDGQAMARPQIPVTLPTYDELIGRDGVTDVNYNERLLARLDPGRLNVLTVHAEVEGMARRALFVDFLDRARLAGWRLVPLSVLLPEIGSELPVAPVVAGEVPGREGAVACQGISSGSQSWQRPPGR